MEGTSRIQPSVCFEVQKVIGVSIGNGNVKNYQVQWAPTWVSGFHLVGCELLIEEFLQQESEKNQFVDDTTTTGVTDTNDVPDLISRQKFQDHIYTQASMAIIDEHCFENEESNTCLYSNTLNDNVNVKVETDMETVVSNEEIYTSDMDASNQTNSNFEFVNINIDDIYSFEDTKDNVVPLSMKKSLHVDNGNTTVNAYGQGSRTLFAGQYGKTSLSMSENEFQNNVLECFETDQTSVDIKRFECNTCSKHFKTVGGLKRHATLCHPDNVVKTYAGKYNSTATKISKDEKATLHEEESLQCASDGKRFKCALCYKKFLRKHHLIEHTRVHTKEQPYKCVQCDKKFSHSSNLATHARLHTGLKPYDCSCCEKKFKTCNELKIHSRVHSGEKPYRCSVCDQSFSQSGHLIKHSRLHTGLKPYQCSECDKKFTSSYDLKRHSRTHTNEKPFSCVVCGKSFSQNSNLRAHEKTHKKTL